MLHVGFEEPILVHLNNKKRHFIYNNIKKSGVVELFKLFLKKSLILTKAVFILSNI